MDFKSRRRAVGEDARCRLTPHDGQVSGSTCTTRTPGRSPTSSPGRAPAPVSDAPSARRRNRRAVRGGRTGGGELFTVPAITPLPADPAGVVGGFGGRRARGGRDFTGRLLLAAIAAPIGRAGHRRGPLPLRVDAIVVPVQPRHQLAGRACHQSQPPRSRCATGTSSTASCTGGSPSTRSSGSHRNDPAHAPPMPPTSSQPGSYDGGHRHPSPAATDREANPMVDLHSRPNVRSGRGTATVAGRVGGLARVLHFDEVPPGIGLAAVEVGEAVGFGQLAAGQ